MNFLDFLIWAVIPMINFGICAMFSYHRSRTYSCSMDSLDQLLVESMQELEEEIECESQHISHCIPKLHDSHDSFIPELEFVNTLKFDEYRNIQLGSLKYPEDIMDDDIDTAIVKINTLVNCQTIHHAHIAANSEQRCFAVAFTSTDRTDYAYNVLRFNSDINPYGISISKPDKSQIDALNGKHTFNIHNKDKLNPAGFFRKVPKEKGRERVKEKLECFLDNFDSVDKQLMSKLRTYGIKEGDDLVVMVVNEGEIDLFLNFACSCRQHNIALSNVLVFAGSSNIIPQVEATGAMALFNDGYASVSRKASMDYLDRVFVDMMWYKAFSIYLILRKRINVLFQDVDLVWFKEPMKYFHDQIDAMRVHAGSSSQIEAFFSDDGQRSMRYTPFYANSGFYYLIASERSEYFAWSIMSAFDAVQVLGSHQNVFTTKLVEGLALGARHAKILSLSEFPNGILYHHDRDYMKRLASKKVDPYNFHMCWTQGKVDKLRYLKSAKMWYMQKECSGSVDNLIAEQSSIRPRHPDGSSGKHPEGLIYRFILDNREKFAGGEFRSGIDEQWDELAAKCCAAMDGSP